MTGPLFAADGIRVAFYYTPLARSGPGLMLRDLLQGDDPDVLEALQVISAADADILVLAGFDFDAGHAAVQALLAHPAYHGPLYPFVFAELPNKGVPSGIDLDGDGHFSDSGDALGYGAFSGQKGLAVLSRYPIDVAEDGNFTKVLWKDMPGANLPVRYFGQPFAGQIADILPLSSTAHWNLSIDVAGLCQLRLMTHHATAPLFDTDAGENRLRNRDENRLWLGYLRGDFGKRPPDGCFVIAADMNGVPEEVLASTLIQDPVPHSGAGVSGAPEATVLWHLKDGVKTLRSDYMLPSRDWLVVGSGLIWPDGFSPDKGTDRHALVWVDLARP